MVNDNEIMVSVCCITYNHEKYIAQSIEGFLIQKTNFKFDIIIGEDCSTDNTLKVIKQYADKHPDKIKLVTAPNNVGSINNQVRVVEAATGKYLAMCDGDDYWSDPDKLQKQVDFLEAHPEYVICSHYSRVIDEDDNTLYLASEIVPLTYSYEDLLLGRREETRIGSLLLRNSDAVRQLSNEDWYYKTHGTDKFFKLFITAETGGKIYVLPEVMSCYRHHAGGVWSMVDSSMRKKRMVSDFNLIIKNFTYTSLQKRKLLKYYFDHYFLFEMKHLRFNNAMSTMLTLI
jgi:glycosyltransferase involved in cell wall biosynthesis